MKVFFIVAFLWPIAVFAQTANPNPLPGSVWTNYGPTLGAGWSDGPPTFGGMNPEASNATLPAARTNLGSLPILNAKTDYGAKGDGTTNDGPALATAFAACNKTNRLYIPPGIYLTRQPLTTPAYCTLYSENQFIYYRGTGSQEQPSAVIVADNSTGGFGVGTATITLGDGAGAYRLASFGATNVDAWNIRNGILFGVLGANGRHGVNCAGNDADTSQILYSDFSLNVNGIVGACPDQMTIGNFSHGNSGAGYTASGVIKAQILSNTFEWNGIDGVKISGAAALAADIIISGNQFDHNPNAGLSLDATGSGITNLTVSNNQFRRSGTGAAGRWHILMTGAFTGLNIIGNNYRQVDGFPDYVYGAIAGTTFASSVLMETPQNQNIGVFSPGTQALMTSNGLSMLSGSLINYTGPATINTTVAGDGVSVDSPAAPAFNLKVSGANKMALGSVTSAGQFDPNAIAGDTVLRTAAGAVRLNTNNGSGAGPLAVEGGNGDVTVNTNVRLVPGTAPGNPASGWRLYTDVADGKLKAKASTGTTVTLGTP